MKNKFPIKSAPLFGALAVCFSLCGYVQPSPRHPLPPTAQYSPQANDLQIRLNSHSALKGARIQVRFASKNSLVLSGTVLSQRQKTRAGQIARKLAKLPVANELRIQRRR